MSKSSNPIRIRDIDFAIECGDCGRIQLAPGASVVHDAVSDFNIDGWLVVDNEILCSDCADDDED